MSDYQQQHEAEMYEAAQNVTELRQYAYTVIVADTGAACLSTDDLEEARTRADTVGGYVRFEHKHAHPDYDPRIDHPERYTDGRPV